MLNPESVAAQSLIKCGTVFYSGGEEMTEVVLKFIEDYVEKGQKAEVDRVSEDQEPEEGSRDRVQILGSCWLLMLTQRAEVVVKFGIKQKAERTHGKKG